MKSKFFILPAMCFILLSACTVGDGDTFNGDDDDNDPEETEQELVGNTWELRSVESGGYGIYAPAEDTSYYVQFNTDSSLSAKSKCNHCGGEFVPTGDSTMIISAFCTEALCGPASEYFDYGAALSSALSYRFDEEGYLYVRSVDNIRGRYVMKHVHADSNKLREVILVNPEGFIRENWLDDPYTVLDAEISGDTLSMNVGFNGCEPHGFNMVFFNYFLESDPVEAQAILTHRSGECAAAPTQELKFNLNPLKEEYRRVYGNSDTGNRVSVVIREDQHTLAEVIYTFEE